MPLHRDSTLENIHRHHRWEVNNQAGLDALVPDALDIHKVAYKKDDDTYHVLKSVSPTVWVQTSYTKAKADELLGLKQDILAEGAFIDGDKTKLDSIEDGATADQTAEEIKIAIGSVIPMDQELQMEVKGRDLLEGLPKVVQVTSQEVRSAIEPIIVRVEEMLRFALEQTPPELVKDIVDQGLILTGGSSQLRGLNIRFSDAMNVPVHLAEQPLYSVALGLGKMLENMNRMPQISVSIDRVSM